MIFIYNLDNIYISIFSIFFNILRAILSSHFLQGMMRRKFLSIVRLDLITTLTKWIVIFNLKASSELYIYSSNQKLWEEFQLYCLSTSTLAFFLIFNFAKNVYLLAITLKVAGYLLYILRFNSFFWVLMWNFLISHIRNLQPLLTLPNEMNFYSSWCDISSNYYFD